MRPQDSIRAIVGLQKRDRSASAAEVEQRIAAARTLMIAGPAHADDGWHGSWWITRSIAPIHEGESRTDRGRR
jgi:hypothetical protein